MVTTKKQKVNINSLPQEIVHQIVNLVVQLAEEENQYNLNSRNPMMNPLANLLEGGGGGPQALLAALLNNGMVNGLGGLFGGGNGILPGQPQPAGDPSDDELPPALEPIRRPGTANAGMHDMPPLEAINSSDDEPTRPATTTNNPTSNNRRVATSSDDDLPPLESI